VKAAQENAYFANTERPLAIGQGASSWGKFDKDPAVSDDVQIETWTEGVKTGDA
jgi:hypothetical protein